MSDISDTVDSFSRNLISLLRYIFPPIIGFLVFLIGYGCELDELNNYEPLTISHISLMLLVAIASGLFVYHIHRAVIHHLFSIPTLFIARVLIKKVWWGTPTFCDLNFARWIRRGEKDDKESKSDKDARLVQKTLDVANAATHFLFCSSWSAVMWLSVFHFGFKQTAPDNPSDNIVFCKGSMVNPEFFWVAFAMLIVAGLIGESWTSFYDVKAYERSNNGTNSEDAQVSRKETTEAAKTISDTAGQASL
jgi:hypothetical protein